MCTPYVAQRHYCYRILPLSSEGCFLFNPPIRVRALLAFSSVALCAGCMNMAHTVAAKRDVCSFSNSAFASNKSYAADIHRKQYNIFEEAAWVTVLCDNGVGGFGNDEQAFMMKWIRECADWRFLLNERTQWCEIADWLTISELPDTFPEMSRAAWLFIGPHSYSGTWKNRWACSA